MRYNVTARFSRSVFLAGLFLFCESFASGHDIPSDLTVQAFVKPGGGRLQLLVRVPLKAIRDVDFPEREGGYLDVEKLAAQLPDLATLWVANVVEIYEGDARLMPARVAATQLSFESDKSFMSFEEARAHTAGPRMTNKENVVWNQVLFDVLVEYPIQSDQSLFSIRPRFERLAARVVTVLRFVTPGGEVRAYEFLGDPGRIPLDPRWHQAAWRFVEMGFLHILDGADHLLFLVCLVIPLRRLRPLILAVTAFTVAHSITLIAAAYSFTPDALWFPPLIETLIAVSIVYMALENIAGTATAGRRWMTAFGFGLVHGFGFSFALRENQQFAGAHLLTSLVSFNIGVELGQLLVLTVLVVLLAGLFRFVVAERMGTIILSALVAHTGWHWMIERAERLRQFQVPWPEWNVPLICAVLFIVGAVVVWAFKLPRVRE